MKTNNLWIILIAVILCSCEKNDTADGKLSKNPPDMPKSVNYDLNDDSIDDIKIEYSLYTWDGINSSGDAIYGSLKPLNGCSVLLKQNDYTLFNKPNDIININANEPYYWEKNSNPDLVSILNSSENDYLWPNEWRIESDMTLDSYYLGVKINTNNNIHIGWIKLKINKSTGAINILDKKFTTEEFIVIGK
jgi:hypothetical protein